MEDRVSAGLYLEMTNAPPDDYVAQRQAIVRAVPGVGIDTLWRNQKPGREDYPRTIPEFETLAVYEVDRAFDAPAEAGAAQARRLRPAGPKLGTDLSSVWP